ncbi:hypothetical protein [Kribbella pratensis]|uniref:Uncharacterized protein n=1 Tax=Kribbella pratensis TaxID=2512112 RepID=A0A4R8BJV9_9ACTN|nr:hypothetical protein [Kribbella pratensis]TDW54836.1 hypothetical protein EV653_8159 [Kribbella pratensis]
MPESAERVRENSPTYREFARLYELARQLRPTGVDRWNRELYETSGSGGYDQETGAIGIHQPLLREGLATQSTANPRLQARALHAVLTRATQAGMDLDAPGETNAVRTAQSRGLYDGVAAVRAATDLQAFSRRAGYPSLTLDDRQQSGAYAAANGLIQQASGASIDRRELIDRLSQGPAVMHFDQVAEAVVRNRLEEIAPAEGADRQAVRRELIETMLHAQWESLAGRSPEAGQHVAEEIRRGLNAKVDEMRRRGPHPARGAESGDVPQQQVGREAPADAPRQEVGSEGPTQVKEVAAARFLNGVAPAAGAAGRGSALGDGSRGAVARAPAIGRGTSMPRGGSAARG